MVDINGVFEELKKTYDVEWIDNGKEAFYLYFTSNDNKKVRMYIDRNYNDCYIESKSIFGNKAWKSIKNAGHNHTDDVRIENLYAEILSTIIYIKNIVNYNYVSSERLNIEKTDSIDGIGVDPTDKTKLIITLMDGMDWTNELEHLLLLQEKMNNYIAYVETKQYLPQYQNIEKVEFDLQFLFKKTEKCEKLLGAIKSIVASRLRNATISVECKEQDG